MGLNDFYGVYYTMAIIRNPYNSIGHYLGPFFTLWKVCHRSNLLPKLLSLNMFARCDRYGMSFFRHRLRHVPEWEEAEGELVLVCCRVCRAIHSEIEDARLCCFYVHSSTEEQGNPLLEIISQHLVQDERPMYCSTWASYHQCRSAHPSVSLELPA